MSNISFTAHGRCARATYCEPITTGSVGLSVSFAFDAAWSGLQKTAIFRGSGMAVDLVLGGDSATVPPEVLTIPGGDLRVGVWGADPDGNVIIPTVWATVGEIVPGAAPSGFDPDPPTPSWAAQVQEIAQDALDTANSVREDADAGEFDGKGFVISGTVADVSELPETAEQGTYYNVGTGAPYTIYMYQDGVGWIDQGQLAGPQGETGPAGPAGQDGDPGATFTPSVSTAGDLSWTNDAGLPNPPTRNIRGPAGENGAPGADGEDGNPGATFTPSVSTSGDLSWTNDAGLPNPPTRNIRGPQGQQGAGLKIMGTVPTFADLPASPALGDAYGVGAAAPYDIYIYGITGWQNYGPLALAVDDALSDYSENPVQNKVINAALTQQKSAIDDLTALTNRKAGMLVDTASGAVASFVPDSTIENLLGVSVDSGATSLYRTGKNLLKNTATTKTIQGVTYTVSSDGTIDVSGSATSYALLTINNTIRLPKSRITLSGLGEATNIVWNQFFLYDPSGAQIGTLIGTGKNQDAKDYTFDLTQYPAVAYGLISVKRGENGAVGGTIKPMIRIAADADEAFLAYNGDTFPVANQTVQDIATITGQINNVWSDAGDVTVEYAADLKHYIDSKIAALIAQIVNS